MSPQPSEMVLNSKDFPLKRGTEGGLANILTPPSLPLSGEEGWRGPVSLSRNERPLLHWLLLLTIVERL